MTFQLYPCKPIDVVLFKCSQSLFTLGNRVLEHQPHKFLLFVRGIQINTAEIMYLMTCYVYLYILSFRKWFENVYIYKVALIHYGIFERVYEVPKWDESSIKMRHWNRTKRVYRVHKTCKTVGYHGINIRVTG